MSKTGIRYSPFCNWISFKNVSYEFVWSFQRSAYTLSGELTTKETQQILLAFCEGKPMPLWVETNGHWWIPLTKGQYASVEFFWVFFPEFNEFRDLILQCPNILTQNDLLIYDHFPLFIEWIRICNSHISKYWNILRQEIQKQNWQGCLPRYRMNIKFSNNISVSLVMR